MLHLLVRSTFARMVDVLSLTSSSPILMVTSFPGSAGSSIPIPSTAYSSALRYISVSDQIRLSNSPCSGQVFLA